MMDNFADLISTLSVVLPIFGVVLVISIAIVLLIDWAWNKTHQPKDQGPLADLYDNYAEPAEAKERMDTLMRPAEGAASHWIDELLTKYQLRLEIDATAGVVRLIDRKHFELKRKVMEFPVSRAVGLDYQSAKKLLSHARFNFNRRAQRQGIVPIKHRKGVN